eukprot:5392510-Prymnesium_polylepis.1
MCRRALRQSHPSRRRLRAGRAGGNLLRTLKDHQDSHNVQIFVFGRAAAASTWAFACTCPQRERTTRRVGVCIETGPK